MKLRRIVDRMKTGYTLTRMPVVQPTPYMMPDMRQLFKDVQLQKEESKPREEGIDIGGGSLFSALRPAERKAAARIQLSYTLLPREGPGPVMAYASIAWDPQIQQLVYSVSEPQLDEIDKQLLDQVKRDLEVRLDVDFHRLGVVRAEDFLKQEIQKSFEYTAQVDKRARLLLTPAKRAALAYQLQNAIIGTGKIEALFQDPNIEDISCDGVNIPLFIYHRDPRIGSVRTNVVFTQEDELNSFVIKLAQKCKREISIAEPLLDGSLPDGSRVQATLGTDIARRGSNFTIRKFTEQPLTPTHMMKSGTINSTMLAYLWLAVENGMSMLISGGSATGKTSMLNAISLFIRPSAKIVSIEDTAEIRIPHSHWVPEVARTPVSLKTGVGDVTMFDLLKSSLRQRPDYIIVGEVRGEETYVLFQQIATGHAGLATIHAANFPQLIDRLITPPIALPPSLLENIDIVLFLALSRRDGNYIRRAASTIELAGMEGNRPIMNTVFEWDAVSDSYMTVGKSLVMKAVAKKLGLTEDTVRDEIARRKRVLDWMKEKNIIDYREVAKVVSAYYLNREKLLEQVAGGR